MRLYHGSYTRIPHPSLNHGRSDIDFGAGFYLTMNYQMAAKWACNKEQSWLNEYDLDEHGLAVKRLSIDDEWLDYVNSNRNRQEVDAPFDDTQYDLIVGPTADDKLFTVVDLYNDGLITKAATLAALSSMADIITTQVVIKTDKAISHLAFLGAEEITGERRDRYIRQAAIDRREGGQAAMGAIADSNRVKDLDSVERAICRKSADVLELCGKDGCDMVVTPYAWLASWACEKLRTEDPDVVAQSKWQIEDLFLAQYDEQIPKRQNGHDECLALYWMGHAFMWMMLSRGISGPELGKKYDVMWWVDNWETLHTLPTQVVCDRAEEDALL